MTKLLAIIISLTTLLIVANSFNKVSHADNSNGCNVQTFEVDSDEDSESDDHLTLAESGGKVDIVFNDTDGVAPSHNDINQVIVTAGSGYEIVNVQYELEHYSGIGWITVAGVNPTTTITLAGVDDDSRIDEVEVKLKTICITPTPTQIITPTPTNTPTNSGGPGDGLGCATHDCSGNQVGGGSAPAVLGASTGPVQAVLGASTLAGTGSFQTSLMNLMLVTGMIVLSLGGISYAKEKKS